ncbi:MAG: hypothetical protein JSW46_10895 [Gemmatimonadota bacterium]|nr:MAG: hypothetical protein JSW46_10895 [Gemmatimonadota bacterium]
MNRRALALAGTLVLGACGGSGVLERTAPERPAWVEVTPAARDSLYFVGICSDLPSYQEGVRCARGEALTDVAAWVGARFSSYVYDHQTNGSRSAGTAMYLDADLFLADLRRSDTYHEVTETGYGTRSYYVSVLLAYPRDAAELEKGRVEETTFRAERLLIQALERVPGVVAEGRWGTAMEILLATASEVAVPRNLHRAGHTARLTDMAEAVVTPLQLYAGTEDRGVEVRARYRGVPAAGLPVQCIAGAVQLTVVLDEEGRAVCELVDSIPGGAGRVIARPEITGYLDAVPPGASELAVALGRLLNRTVVVELEPGFDMDLVLAGRGDCEPAMEVLRERLSGAGVRVIGFMKGVPALEVSCQVSIASRQGELYVASARGALSLKAAEHRGTEVLAPVSGLGASVSVARDDALLKLGEELAASALKLLGDLDDQGEK